MKKKERIERITANASLIAKLVGFAKRCHLRMNANTERIERLEHLMAKRQQPPTGRFSP